MLQKKYTTTVSNTKNKLHNDFYALPIFFGRAIAILERIPHNQINMLGKKCEKRKQKGGKTNEEKRGKHCECKKIGGG